MSNKGSRQRRRKRRGDDPNRSHRVKIAGALTLEELSQALQMALARMEEEGHRHVGQISLYYRPVDDPAADAKDSRTIEIALPKSPLAGD